jgi:hypothetical protein
MNRNENFEDLATAQVSRAQSRRKRLAPLGGLAGLTGGLMAGAVVTVGFGAGMVTGMVAGSTNGFVSGFGNTIVAGGNTSQAFQNGIQSMVLQGVVGGVIGGIMGGISAVRQNRNFWTEKKPYYEVTLKDYTLIYQDPKNCKNATLESIEKMNGGTRTQADFKLEGEKFLKEFRNKYGREATLEEYFEHFGFDVRDPSYWTYKQIGRGMELGNPTVIEENIAGGHTLTIIKIRQWTPNSKVKVWFGDPYWGVWKANWTIIGNSSFNKGAYLFWLNK